ncbi:MAG TPA: endonuclease III, partial [Gemmatimonadaceae bacterium]
AARSSAKRAPAKSPKRKVKATPEYAAEIYRRLVEHYPDAHCALDYTSPFQLLVATILSAQCTDKRVNIVTPALFAKYPTPEALAAANPEDVEELIKTTGFFRNKAKNLLGMANAVDTQHGGRIPEEMDALVKLPGVGRKTANVVLGNAFGKNEGVVVDTHVSRVSHRLGLTKQSDPVKIERDLVTLFPRDEWTLLSHLLIEHGRRICDARRPKCEMCFLNDLCPSSRVLYSTQPPLE